MTLFIYLKIILLQCFQFLAISNIQTDPKMNFKVFFFGAFQPMVSVLDDSSLLSDQDIN